MLSSIGCDGCIWPRRQIALSQDSENEIPKSQFRRISINVQSMTFGIWYSLSSCSRHPCSSFKSCNRKSKINIIHKRRSQHHVKCSPTTIDSKIRENKQWASHIRREEIQSRVRSIRCTSVKAFPTPGPAPSSFHLDSSHTSQ